MARVGTVAMPAANKPRAPQGCGYSCHGVLAVRLLREEGRVVPGRLPWICGSFSTSHFICLSQLAQLSLPHCGLLKFRYCVLCCSKDSTFIHQPAMPRPPARAPRAPLCCCGTADEACTERHLQPGLSSLQGFYFILFSTEHTESRTRVIKERHELWKGI